MDKDNAIEKRFFVKIVFNPEKGAYHPSETAYYRDDMSLNFLMRWKWYFEYQAALLRVRNPHAFIELSSGPYDYVLPEDEYRQKLYNLLLAAKRKLSEYQRKIDFVREHWDELFPMEQHPKWGKVQEKVRYYEERVQALSAEYETIK